MTNAPTSAPPQAAFWAGPDRPAPALLPLAARPCPTPAPQAAPPRPVAGPEPITPPAPATSRRPALGAAVSAALISTASAYLAMVEFGRDVFQMDPATAYATAGVFEISLVTVALLAREAAKDNRPGGTLLTLTWALSSASGAFAAWHEIFIGHPLGAAIFRFLVPLLAALMWHLALIGDRHLASGRTWSQMLAGRRMHVLFQAVEAERRARHLDHGARWAQWRVRRAEAARLRAKSTALRTVPPEQMRATTVVWTASRAAVSEATATVIRQYDDGVTQMATLPAAPQEAPARPAPQAVTPAAPAAQTPAPASPPAEKPFAAQPPAVPTRRRKLTRAERDELKAQARELQGAMTQREIAVRLGVGKSTVDRWLKQD